MRSVTKNIVRSQDRSTNFLNSCKGNLFKLRNEILIFELQVSWLWCFLRINIKHPNKEGWRISLFCLVLSVRRGTPPVRTKIVRRSLTSISFGDGKCSIKDNINNFQTMSYCDHIVNKQRALINNSQTRLPTHLSS